MASTRLANFALQDLHAAAGTPAQLQVLRTIKYDLTGHLSRKLECIHNGLIPLLAKVLASITTRLTSTSGIAVRLEHDDELVFTQVSQLVCVIAHEGPSFVQPLLETDVLQSLVLFLLQPLSSKTTLTILKCLNAVADNLPPSNPSQWSQNGKLADVLYSKNYIHCFGNVVERASDTVVSQQACDAILTLLCKTITHETQKRALVEDGFLKLLSARLASFVVAEGLVPPVPDTLDSDNSVFAAIPDAAPSFAHLSPVLECISLLIEHSKSRAKLFLSDPAIMAVLPDLKDDFSPSDIRRAPWGASYFSGGAVPRSRLYSSFDSLLPFTPPSEKASSATQSGFPPLSSVTTMPKRRASGMPSTAEAPHLAVSQDAVEDAEESAVISWLLYVIRESRGKRRLLAAKLLVNLHSMRFVKRARGSSFASLLVPLLTRMLDPDPTQLDTLHQPSGSYLCNGMHYARAVPSVLAALVMDDLEMQTVAVEGKAIVSLATGLKMTFDGPAGRKSSPWQPHKSAPMDTDQMTPGTRLGSGGPTWTVRREMDYREGCLKALAAMAAFENDYRTAVCDQGILSHIVQALEPYQAQIGANQQIEVTGNPASVMLAACGAVRALARSVQALRTKLVEAEVAKPILRLMNSTNPEIRIAATKVLTNLALDFSAVKESVGELTVVKKLCEQAHSANARLRMESLWALKQLVLNANKKLKQDVVDELGSSWIKLLIKTDPIDIPEGEVIGLVEREYPPITRYRKPLGPVDNTHDVLMGEGSEPEADHVDPPSSGLEETFDQNGGFDTRHTIEDDTEIQAQLLDLLRNLFCGDNASELVKYIFAEMGQDDLFRILLDRLRPRTLAGPTRKENYTTPAPSIIVKKVLYILVHVCACDPKWRNVIASQHALLKQVLTFCSHADREVRAQCCWIAINLTFEDDANDRAGCRHRAIELQKVGYVGHLRRMETDPDLNVRERAKAAIHLMSKLMAS